MPKIDFTGKPGEYTYTQSEYGKGGKGVVQVGATSSRNPSAQRSVGGEDRQPADHGGHLIAHSLGGRNDITNLDAQNANVNQIGQRHVEQDVARLAKDPNKSVYLDVQNYNSPGVDRPEATMITVGVLDKTTGQVDVAHYSFQNASYEEQAQWDQIANENTEIDPRQDIGMTPEERALANEYADLVYDDIELGAGRTFFLDPSAEPIMDGQNNTMDDGVSLGSSSCAGMESVDDGLSLGAGSASYGSESYDDGMSLGSSSMDNSDHGYSADHGADYSSDQDMDI